MEIVPKPKYLIARIHPLATIHGLKCKCGQPADFADISQDTINGNRWYVDGFCKTHWPFPGTTIKHSPAE